MAILSAALGAVLVIGSLFAFQVLADKIFVTRREFEAFQKALEDRLTRTDKVQDERHASVVTKLDTLTDRTAVLVGAKALQDSRREAA